MQTRTWTPLLIVLLLAGCAGTQRPQYEPPTEGPVANLQLVNSTQGRTSLALYEDPVHCTGRTFTPDLLAGERRTVSIPADEPVTFTVHYEVPNAGRSVCLTTLTFEAEPGELYQALLTPRPGNSCDVKLARMQFGTPTAVGFTQRATNHDGNDETGFCVANE